MTYLISNPKPGLSLKNFLLIVLEMDEIVSRFKILISYIVDSNIFNMLIYPVYAIAYTGRWDET